MKPQHWLPPVVFLAVSIPAVMLLSAAGVSSELRLIIAIGAGALAVALVQSRLKQRGDKE